ncbi:MAG: hypothetical protein ACHQFZ_04300 [Acidimicrobiales bacterium]
MWTAVAALIGAVVGTVGSQVVRYWLSERSLSRQDERKIVEKHLLTLQDAVASLWFRITNIQSRYGMSIMSWNYYRATTMYALGTVFAIKRSFLLDGIYGRLQSLERERTTPLSARLRHSRSEHLSYAEMLWNALEQFEGMLDRQTFHRYERLALGEATMEITPQGWRLAKYTDFCERLEEASASGAYEGVDELLRIIGTTDSDPAASQTELRGAQTFRSALLTSLDTLGKTLSSVTGMAWKPTNKARPTEKVVE